MTIRVLVVATAAIVRSGLVAMLTTDSTIIVVGTTADLDLLAADVDKFRPDLILLDLGNLVGGASVKENRASVWEKLASIQESQDPIGIVVTMADFEGLNLTAAMRSGVRGILPATSSESAVVAAVVAVAMGLVVIDPSAIELFYTAAKVAANPEIDLTPREIEVLVRLGAAMGNKSIAQSLHISEHTVKFHISSIFQKLGVSTRTEAVTMGVRLGLILL
jgi:two-component system, NarL family, response regulator YdfI